QQQIPPMYSALKLDGKPLYQYAREGRTVERPPREITVHEIRLIEAAPWHLTLDVAVSSGTYIRTLLEDIARSWQGCAHLADLRRTAVAHLPGPDIPAMMPLDELEDEAAGLQGRLPDW